MVSGRFSRDRNLAPAASIHAPARGATPRRSRRRRANGVSIHACARGDRNPVRRRYGPTGCFDPRPCARGDSANAGSRPGRRGFDPRPCARGDTRWAALPGGATRFDPRPCARGDHASRLVDASGIGKFRSTPLREGRHQRHRRRQLGADVSIHAPARGATERFDDLGGMADVSIHAPARGATLDTDKAKLALLTFRSTPLREGRQDTVRG